MSVLLGLPLLGLGMMTVGGCRANPVGGTGTDTVTGAGTGTGTGMGYIVGVARGYGGPAIATENGGARMAINGKPLTGHQILAQDSRGKDDHATTDNQGRFSIAVQPGNYKVWACAGETITVDVKPGRTVKTSPRCDFP